MTARDRSRSAASHHPHATHRPSSSRPLGLHTIVNQDSADAISRAFIKGHWYDALLLASEYTGQRRVTFLAHFRINKYIQNPHHNIKVALTTIAIALGDINTLQTSLTLNTVNLIDSSHALKCKQAITRALVLGVLAIHGHKDREIFLTSLSALGLNDTDTQQSCLQEYFAITQGIPGAFLHSGSRRRSSSNKRWVSYENFAETMNEHTSYNQGYNGPIGIDRRLHTMEIEYSLYTLDYNGPFMSSSPFSYFHLFLNHLPRTRFI